MDAAGDSAEPSTKPSTDRVCLVATRPATFERCRDGIYPSPASYGRTTEPFDYLAFYRTAPVSAVTHYAYVTERVDQYRDQSGPMTATDWETLVDPFSDTDHVVVFTFGDLTRLETPVTNDTTGVRGAWYCSLAELRAAAHLSEL